MVDGYWVCIVLWYIYVTVFQITAYDTNTSSVCGFIVVHNCELLYLYWRVRYCWTGVYVGQLALQYCDSWRNDADALSVGNVVSAKAL